MKQAIGSDQKNMLELAGVSLSDGEHLVSTVRIHDAIYWKGLAVALLGILLLPGFAMSLGIFFIFVGFVMLGLAHMTRQFLVLAATNKRIFVRSGILYADMIELRYSQVESIELGITPIGQIFGYGSVIITGTGQRRVIVKFVSDAIDFRRIVNDILVNR